MNKTNQVQSKNSIFEENELTMGLMIPKKSSIDLLQNCDLPPPLKVYNAAAAGDKLLTAEDISDWVCGGVESQKLELLKALRRSQTRAREAERKGAEMAKERNCLCKAMVDESLQLFGYRQLVRLLEHQVWKMQLQSKMQETELCNLRKKEDDDKGEEGSGGMRWAMALAVCLGIAGVGFAFGFRYSYLI